MKMDIRLENSASKKLRAFAKIFPGVARGAKEKAGMSFLHDIVHEAPTPPLMKGNLRRSATVYIGREKFMGGGPQTNASGKKGVVSLVMGVVYAWFQHELNKDSPGKTKYSNADPNIGPLFMLQKLIDFGDEYQEMMTEYIRDEAKRKLSKIGLYKPLGVKADGMTSSGKKY